MFFGWECCPCWHRFAKYVEYFILDAFMDLFITLCIVANTAFMAIDHHQIDPDLRNVLEKGNYVSSRYHCVKYL